MRTDSNYIYISGDNNYFQLDRCDSHLENLEKLLKNVSFKELFEIIKHLVAQPSDISVILLKKLSVNYKNFIYNNQEYWIDKETRMSLFKLLDIYEENGDYNFDLILGDEIITMPLNIAKNFLESLELYASKCLVTTKKHIQAINALENIEDIENYDYTSGYPEKITLTI